MKYFGDLEQLEERESTRRSSCIRMGTFLAIRKILEGYGLSAMIRKYFGERESEDSAAQHYSAYAYNHPLFTRGLAW